MQLSLTMNMDGGQIQPDCPILEAVFAVAEAVWAVAGLAGTQLAHRTVMIACVSRADINMEYHLDIQSVPFLQYCHMPNGQSQSNSLLPVYPKNI